MAPGRIGRVTRGRGQCILQGSARNTAQALSTSLFCAGHAGFCLYPRGPSTKRALGLRV